MKEIALVCAGTKFDPNIYIKQIYHNLGQYCTDFRLTIFTDQHVDLPGVRTVRLPDWPISQDPRKLWWYKTCTKKRW